LRVETSGRTLNPAEFGKINPSFFKTNFSRKQHQVNRNPDKNNVSSNFMPNDRSNPLEKRSISSKQSKD